MYQTNPTEMSVNVSLHCTARSRSGAIPEALGVEDGWPRSGG